MVVSGAPDGSPMPIALYALSLAAFSIGTTEFIISGILPAVSADLGVSIPTAGLLVTGYAVGVAIGGPILAMLTTRLPARPLITAVMLVFALGQLLCALAPDYLLLLGARLVSACGHGVFFGVASVAVSRLVPESRRGAALSLFVGGITIANILGLPGGTAIGNAFGWRAAFLAIAAFALAATLLIAVTLPRDRRAELAEPPLRLQAAQLRQPPIFLSYLVIAISMVGGLSFGTFQVPILIDITGVAPAIVPYFLLFGGAGAVAGIWLGGRLADWRLMPSLLGVLLAQTLTYAGLLFSVHHPVAMALNMALSGMFGFAFSTPAQVRILHAARQAPNLASTLISTAYNVGIALGAWVGAVWIANGLGYALLPAIGIVTSLLAATIVALSLRLDRAAAHEVTA